MRSSGVRPFHAGRAGVGLIALSCLIALRPGTVASPAATAIRLAADSRQLHGPAIPLTTLTARSLKFTPAVSASPSVPAAVSSPWLLQIVDDMRLSNQALPQGVPLSYSWSRGPHVGNPGPAPRGYGALTGWGTVYLAANSRPAAGVRIEIRDARTFVLSRSQRTWVTVQESVGVQGAYFAEAATGNGSWPAALRTEPDGGTSVALEAGRSFQFWPLGQRPSIDPSDVLAVLTTVQARLLPSKGAASARYLVNSGADYWRSPTAAWPGNSEVFIGRLHLAATNWVRFSGYSCAPVKLGWFRTNLLS